MRMRCEKKKQKDAERRQEELTTEQLAEKQANADACAQVSLLYLISTSLHCLLRACFAWRLVVPGLCLGRLAGQGVASLYACLQRDFCLQALLADLAAEKEKESLTQKAKAKKAKAKGDLCWLISLFTLTSISDAVHNICTCVPW